MRTLLLAAVMIVVSCTAAAALECRASRGHDGKYWAWREIDGRRCWYAGARGMSKARLHWSARRALAKAKPKPPAPVRAIADDATMLETIWPAPPATDTFAERWHGDRK